MKNREFETGANRNASAGKHDIEAFNCPMCDHGFNSYMHEHRMLEDGTLRDGDNWQKGIPDNELLKSAMRHMHDWRLIERGFYVYKEYSEEGETTHVFTKPLDPLPENFHLVTLEEALDGLRFNAVARRHNKHKEN